MVGGRGRDLVIELRQRAEQIRMGSRFFLLPTARENCGSISLTSLENQVLVLAFGSAL